MNNIFFILCLLVSVNGYAQDVPFERTLSDMHAQYMPENVYLHLDKSFCMAGDTIWFKGYVLQGNRLSDNSTSLHVELFDKKGALLQAKVFQLYSGIAVGQVEIPLATAADVYYVRAYTKWQCNFDTRLLYQVPITVIDSKSNTVTVLDKLRRNNGSSAAFKDSITLISSETPRGLYCTVFGDEGCRYLDSALQLFFIAPGVTGKASLTLSKNRLSKEALFPSSPQFAGHEADVILLSPSGKVIAQDKIFFHANDIAVDILPDTLNVTEKGLNAWRVLVKDTSILSLSIAVTDADVYPNSISINNSISGTVLNYQDLLDGKMPDAALVDSNFIRCRGIAQRSSNRQLIRNKHLLAFITTKDSSTNFVDISIDSAGRFDLNNLVFYDTATVRFQLQDKESRAKDIDLKFDWFAPPPFSRDSNTYVYTNRAEVQSTPLIAVTKRKDNLFAFDKIGAMEAVVVKAKKKTVVEKMDEEYASSGFKVSSDMNARSFDLINDNSALGMDLLNYLQGRMPGVLIKRDTNGRAVGLLHRGSAFLFFLNEMQVPFEVVENISLFNIAYIVVHPAPFVMGTLMQGGVCIYTKKGSELETPEVKATPERIIARHGNDRRLDKSYATGYFSKPGFFFVDLRTAQMPFDLFKYMQEKLPGFVYEDTSRAQKFVFCDKLPQLFIDEKKVDASELATYRYKAPKLAFIKILDNYPDSGKYVLAVYTRKGKDVQPVPGLLKTSLPGYQLPRLPYSYDYSNGSRLDYADNRVNLYWNPFFGGENVIRFYNNDYTKRFRVIIEGIGTKGELLHFEKIVQR